MSQNLINWLLFALLSIIWGSSFVLMKEGLQWLSPYQMAALRIVFAGLVLLPYALQAYKKIPSEKLFTVFMSGVLGSLLPAFLFCLAEDKDKGIDSALAGTFNSLTPIFVIIIGALFYKAKSTAGTLAGIAVAFSGSLLLLWAKGGVSSVQNLWYAGYVVLGTVCYGFNVNMVYSRLKNTSSIDIAALALVLNGLVALVILYFTGYFKLPLMQKEYLLASGYTAVLGVLGSAVASILFYVLVKKSGAVFSSMVTYGIPVVANIIGFMYGDDVTWKQWLCLVIMLGGVYIANYFKEKN